MTCTFFILVGIVSWVDGDGAGVAIGLGLGLLVLGMWLLLLWASPLS